jgi:tRNA(Ile)-lysidine synthetase-like protein
MEDTDIYLRYTELYNWWFNPINKRCWFDSTDLDDIEISNLFGDLLDPEFIELTDLSKLDHIHAIGFILVHDQIIRHWARANFIKSPEEFFDSHYNIMKNFITNFYCFNKDKINGYEFCFVLLPLRHTQDYLKIKFVLNETWEKLSNTPEDNQELKQIYKNYLKATYSRAKYNIISQAEISNLTNMDIDLNMQTNIEYYINKYRKVLDTKCYNYTNNIKTNNSDKLIEKFFGCKNINKSANLIVSISGGVDSMVLSWILKKLGYNIILVHINYSNRADTDLEQELVIDWGKYLGIRTFFRVLDEINRPKCMENDLRNVYESYTRDQRYLAYTKAADQMGWTDNYSIVLGHNHDDCIENVFTNIASKSKWDNLYGMNWESKVQFNNIELTFLRPFISNPKSDIYEFAEQNQILFLWDSTPKWSQRGKIRDIVRPGLEEFNSEIISGLDSMVKTLKESIECVGQMVDIWIETEPGYLLKKIIPINKLIKSNIFWDKLFVKLGVRTSTKSLESFVVKLYQIEKNFESNQINRIEKFQFNKELQISWMKNKDNQLVITI